MQSTERTLALRGIKLPDILIPAPSVDMKKWAVIACDQYTSEPEYWQQVEKETENAPSTAHLVFPEIYLSESREKCEKRIKTINQTMKEYLDKGIFRTLANSFMLVERTSSAHTRYGLVAALDLDCYDYTPGSTSLIRATEQTILERIPPRKAIRENAPLELPHIIVLIDDEENRLLGPLVEKREKLETAYSTLLMQNSGSVTGWQVDSKEDIARIAEACDHLASRSGEAHPLLFAMGDGNHSLATAKSIWETVKPTLSEEERENHPARFALVEIENIHDPGIEFSPIHRLFMNLNLDEFKKDLESQCSAFECESVQTLEELTEKVNKAETQSFGYIDENGYILFTLKEPSASIAAGTIQNLIDSLPETVTTDYIHGIEVIDKKGKERGNCALLLPDIRKDNFFNTIREEGCFPRKTFSMGCASEKRFYLEARKITL